LGVHSGHRTHEIDERDRVSERAAARHIAKPERREDRGAMVRTLARVLARVLVIRELM
jgi:hypothetical protein